MANKSIEKAFERMWQHTTAYVDQHAGGSDGITGEQVLEMFIEMDVVQPMADNTDAILTDKDENVFIF